MRRRADRSKCVHVDGRSAAGNPNYLEFALAKAGDERVSHLRRLVDGSAAFDIGKTFRSSNYSMLVLSYLDPRRFETFDAP